MVAALTFSRTTVVCLAPTRTLCTRPRRWSPPRPVALGWRLTTTVKRPRSVTRRVAGSSTRTRNDRPRERSRDRLWRLDERRLIRGGVKSRPPDAPAARAGAAAGGGAEGAQGDRVAPAWGARGGGGGAGGGGRDGAEGERVRARDVADLDRAVALDGGHARGRRAVLPDHCAVHRDRARVAEQRENDRARRTRRGRR